MKKSNFITYFFLSAFGSLIFVGCDQLQEDVLPESADLVSLNSFEKNLFIMPGGETLIDLPSKLRIHDDATLEIGESPKNGSLHFVDGGLLQYAAFDHFKDGTDFFTLQVMRNSQILDQDTFNIIIPSDRTQYPCWNGAISDPVAVMKDSTEMPYQFNILANDYFCDSMTISLGVKQQPQFGKAEIVDHLLSLKVDIGADKTLASNDFLIYELCQTLKGGEKHCSLARVNIRFQEQESCDFMAVDDLYILGNDPANSENTFLAKVDILKNDQSCNSLKELSITKNADNGDAYIQDNYLYYSYPQQELYTDSLRYQICNLEGICSEATLRFGVE